MAELISVIVPVYNMGESLEKCVASILEQDGADYELILVDDGSKDDSWARCQRREKNDVRISAYHQENQGPGPARNLGISKARGRYAYFPDADDTLSPHALQIMLAAMKKNQSDLVVFGYQAMDQKGEVRRKKTYPEFVKDAEAIRQDFSDYASMKTKFGIKGAPWNKFFDLEIIREHHVVFPPLRRYEDEVFISRYMCWASKVQFIEDVLYTYYMNDLTLEWKKFPDDYYDLVQKFYAYCHEDVLAWNPKDTKTTQIVNEEYVDGIVRALELNYSPKYNYSSREIKRLVKQQVEQSSICSLEIYSDYSSYKKALLHLFKKKQYGAAMMAMWLKIRAEKMNMDRMSKKYRN